MPGKETKVHPSRPFGRTGILALPGLILTLLGIGLACGGDDGDVDPTPGSGNGSQGVSGTVSLEGSSTVQPVTLELIPAFADEFPRIDVNPPSGLGSGAGITAFINGEVEIAQASRGISADEVEQARDAGLEPFETRIFNDALAMIVHPNNPVEQLTVEQVAKIFAGEISDWSEVGGDGGSITIYARNEESGTFAYMEEDVVRAALGEESAYSSDINKQASAPVGIRAVANDKSGIFYAGLGNLAEVPAGSVKVLLISAGEGSSPVAPSAESVSGGQYPIARGLFYYTDGDPAQHENPAVKAFIDFALGPVGQAIGEELGFIPVGPTR